MGINFDFLKIFLGFLGSAIVLASPFILEQYRRVQLLKNIDEIKKIVEKDLLNVVKKYYIKLNQTKPTDINIDDFIISPSGNVGYIDYVLHHDAEINQLLGHGNRILIKIIWVGREEAPTIDFYDSLGEYVNIGKNPKYWAYWADSVSRGNG